MGRRCDLGCFRLRSVESTYVANQNITDGSHGWIPNVSGVCIRRKPSSSMVSQGCRRRSRTSSRCCSADSVCWYFRSSTTHTLLSTQRGQNQWRSPSWVSAVVALALIRRETSDTKCTPPQCKPTQRNRTGCGAWSRVHSKTVWSSRGRSSSLNAGWSLKRAGDSRRRSVAISCWSFAMLLSLAWLDLSSSRMSDLS